MIYPYEFLEKFEAYSSVLQLFNSNISAAKKQVGKMTLIPENFIKFSLVQNQDDVRYIEDEEEYPLATLLANIGGAMSLWIGLTLMVLVEFFEFIFDLITLFFRREKDDNENENVIEKEEVKTEAILDIVEHRKADYSEYTKF